MIDFQMMNTHAGLYVRKPREEANLIIGRGNTTSHDHHGGSGSVLHPILDVFPIKAKNAIA